MYSELNGRRFEYDIAKSLSNKEKHGIDFEEAQQLWDDNRKVRLNSAYESEPRNLTIAKYNDDVYVAVTTDRDDKIRIISVRRAHDNEVRIYGETKNDR